jgi:hypothetical protein
MMVEKRILEAIDACRPESDDLRHPELADAAEQIAGDPELARLREQIIALDAKIGAAMGDVPVPADLAARLLARLQAEPTETIAATPPDEPAATPRRRFGWKRAAAALALAAALLVGATLALFDRAPRRLTPDGVRRFAQQRYEELSREDDWRELTSAPLDRYPPSRRVAGRPRRWQRLPNAVDGRAVAYDLTPRGSRYKTTLMVLHTQVAGLSNLPPKKPFWTQGRLVAAWRQGDLLYVLVLEAPDGGGAGLPLRYRQLVDTSAGIVG